MSAILLEGRLVHYEALGRGRPVVFLHGWIGSWRYWVPAMQSLSTAYRAYALDLWGFGDTAKSRQRYDLPQQVDLLARFIAAMGLPRVALVGHGLGALVALLYAHRHSTLVDRLMAVAFPARADALNMRLTTETPARLARKLLPQDAAAPHNRAEAAKADPQAIKVSLAHLSSLDLDALSGDLGSAALFVHGQDDPLVSTPAWNHNGSLPPNLHFLPFEAAGHFPMLDHPNQFNRLLADFLALEADQSPRGLQLKQEWVRRVR